MGISGCARSASTEAARVDGRDRIERDRCRRGASWNGKVATLTGGLAHDVSILLGIGRQLGSRPRANTSITIIRAPQRGHGQDIIRGVSVAISGCSCGSAATGAALRSVRAVAMFSARLDILGVRRHVANVTNSGFISEQDLECWGRTRCDLE